MRFNIALILLCIASLAVAQSTTMLQWEGTQKSATGEKQLYFQGASHTQNGIPYYSRQYKGKYVTKAQLANITYEVVNTNEKGAVNLAYLSDDFNVSVAQGKARGQWISEVVIVPVRNRNGVLEKLTSFEINLTEGTPPLSKSTYPWKTTSVFASGDWYKIGVTKTGMHKIDHAFIQERLGVDPSAIDPRNIKIYGNGGAMLPQANSETWYDDVDQNAIYVKGESDGTFNSGDYILFYAKGIMDWELVGDSVFNHAKNVYCDTSYYFINLTSSGAGKRIGTLDNMAGAAQDITYFDDYDVFESDDHNIVKSGRNWYGHEFDFDLNETFGFSMSGIRSTPGITLTTSLGALSKSATSFDVRFNGTDMGNVSLESYSGDYLWLKKSKSIWNTSNIGAGVQTVTLQYNKGSSSASVGYVDYIKIQAQRNLALYGKETSFRSIQSMQQPVSQFIISGMASTVFIWDVTDIVNIKEQAYSLVGSTAGFAANTSELKEFHMFSGSNFDAPTYVGKVGNQNIHALAVPHFLIITHSRFKDEAERLAEHRRNHDGLIVEVVDIAQIYNEFSSGKKDPSAIRNLAKMMYDRDGSTFKYLLLFGDCSYDYKNRISGNRDFVSVYESRDSEYAITSHSSDDYFALLDDNEGVWCESGFSCTEKEFLDIGVGRIPSKTIEEAESVVSKIIHYDKEKKDIQACNDVTTYVSGKWKNEVVLIADDSDGNRHMNSAEIIADQLKNYPEYHVDKIYLDAFEQVSGAGGQSSPAVKDAINKKMERGALIFNYSGHGGELGLSHEGIITVDQIKAWSNLDNMPLMFTATCEFGRYDDPERTSAGEYTLLNDKGGVVAIVTTTRPVYSNENTKINTAFFGNVFNVVDSVTQELPRLGDVMRKAKNGSTTAGNVNNRNFALLGDPSMRLAYPKHEVHLTSINQAVLDTVPDTLSALSKIQIGGEVRSASGQLMSDFNGVLEASIFDKISTYTTLGDESGSPENFEERDVKIFEGLATVTNGIFNFTFIVPKDINYTFGSGKAMFYASSPNLKTDAHGSNDEFIVGGTSRNIEQDEVPPQISIFMNDETFVFGGTTGENAILLAKLFDENGINTTGVGIGHEISAVLDDKSDKSIVLNDFYTSELDDYQRGIVKYPLENLAPGTHRITLKAWDTYNNSNEDYLEFIVVNDEDLALQHVLNYPNPFTTNTEFHFDHNRACDDLEVTVQVYTISGKLVKTLNENFLHAPAHISGLNWNGKDDFEQNIGRGVYVYKVKVRSLTDGSQVHEYQKLVILK